ncbi:hypothetical protein DM860_010501 [Cuscuta australis]|uniref:Cation efflux protein transmembrane domain-containing protein n=1 Tax=Cuscuta australis TaxID=267555 RepID=A0A328E5Q5_9ASTE|nr:hypothetical protein DM860_010501 [Cuscuta australis]
MATELYDSRINYRKVDAESPRPPSSGGGFDFGGSDRRFAFSRQVSFQQSNSFSKPLLMRNVSSIDIPDIYYRDSSERFPAESKISDEKFSASSLVSAVFRGVTSGNKPMRRLFLLISLNVAYSTVELCVGLFSGRVGLVSDAFHLTFGCGLLTFSLFAMAISRKKPDGTYTYGYKRLEVLSAFTNALFLLFLSFSLAVEALHAFIQDESEHKHYLIVSAVTNLLVNLIGVWFFRNYARINLVYRKAEDMNYHSVCLHVIADSIRSAGLILASWLLALGVKNAEVLCLGMVSAAVFLLVMPLFKATGGILLQTAPSYVSSSAFNKCRRQVTSREDVSELFQARFWEMVPGHAIGSISVQMKNGMDDGVVLQYVRDLYHDLGVQDLTLQIDMLHDTL